LIPGEGLPPLRGGARGDQHVVLELVVPRELSDEERELATRLDETISGQPSAAARKPSK
jgi:DnaJ-class molecular chaperone